MNDLAPSSQPQLSFAEECNRGKVREENQDSVLHFQTPLGDLLVVADGIGGLEGGATASRIVTETFREHLCNMPPGYSAGTAIREASARTNARILAAAAHPDSPHKRMGSTVVLALIQRPVDQPAQEDAAGTRDGTRVCSRVCTRVCTRVWIGHIGDSRAYLLRGGRIRRITKDHSAVQALLDQNLITPEEAGNHPDASVLTRSLGSLPHVDIDIDLVPLAPGDSLLLCSDGLWGFVPEQELQAVMADAHLPIEATARTLLEMALAAGGHDNIGIELMRVDLPPTPIPDPVPEPDTMQEPIAVQEPITAQEPIAVREPATVVEPVKIEQPIASPTPLAATEVLTVAEPPIAQKPLQLGFIAILLICLLAGAAVGAVLYFAFFGH
jgi:PPM family protein phosphatase